MKITNFLLFMLCLTFTFGVFAHPVSFKGSTGIMGHHSSNLTHNQLNYSFRHWFATGIHHIRRSDTQNAKATFASTNFLLKRWNGSGHQANIYMVLGIGNSSLAGTSETSGMSLLQFDIEDRDYYFLIKSLGVFRKENTDFQQTVVRVGITPYVENFNGIHSWLILEWQNSKFSGENNISDLTPFLRIFHRNLLFEIGQSFDGVTKFNYITHF